MNCFCSSFVFEGIDLEVSSILLSSEVSAEGEIPTVKVVIKALKGFDGK